MIKRSTPHVMLYAELGRFQITLLSKREWLNIGLVLHNNITINFTKMLYNVILDDFMVNNNNYKWFNKIKSIIRRHGNKSCVDRSSISMHRMGKT